MSFETMLAHEPLIQPAYLHQKAVQSVGRGGRVMAANESVATPDAESSAESNPTLFLNSGEADAIELDTPFLPSTLAWQSVPAHNTGNAPLPLAAPERRRLVVRTIYTLAFILVSSLAALVFILWLALPQLNAYVMNRFLTLSSDRDALRLPQSITQLKELTEVLRRYSHEFYYRVMIAWVAVYLFLQTFSVPGSMYMSILAGALWTVPVALPLVCTLIATGATFCYLLSRHTGEFIRVMPRWHQRVEAWKVTVQQYEDRLLTYLTILRMMPVPPHFVVNIIAPHLGVPVPTFWLSTLLGVISSSLIHTAIGEELDDMTNSSKFRIISAKNILLLLSVCAASLLPLIVRRYVQSPEPDYSAPGAIRLDEAPSTFRSRVHKVVDRILVLVDPAWARRPQHVGITVPELENAAVPRDESTSAWADAAASRTQRPLSAMPPLTENEVFHDSDEEVEASASSYAALASRFVEHTPNRVRGWWYRWRHMFLEGQ